MRCGFFEGSHSTLCANYCLVLVVRAAVLEGGGPFVLGWEIRVGGKDWVNHGDRELIVACKKHVVFAARAFCILIIPGACSLCETVVVCGGGDGGVWGSAGHIVHTRSASINHLCGFPLSRCCCSHRTAVRCTRYSEGSYTVCTTTLIQQHVLAGWRGRGRKEFAIIQRRRQQQRTL